MTFQQYYDLFQSAAQQYDETMSRTKKSPRSVYMSEITQDDEEHYADAEEGYDIDTTVDVIQNNFHNSTRQANVNQRRPPVPNNTRLPPDAWSYLSQDDRLMWMELSRETKALVLGLKSPPAPNNKAPSSRGNMKSMLHAITVLEFINNIDESYPTTQSIDITNDNTTTLLENSTSLHDNKISHTDIRKVLSTTNSSNLTN